MTQLCITWNEPGGEHNSDLFTLEELARALSTGAFTGSQNIYIELVPDEQPLDIWDTPIPWLEEGANS